MSIPGRRQDSKQPYVRLRRSYYGRRSGCHRSGSDVEVVAAVVLYHEVSRCTQHVIDLTRQLRKFSAKFLPVHVNQELNFDESKEPFPLIVPRSIGLIDPEPPEPSRDIDIL